jgi:hypothetical protein
MAERDWLNANNYISYPLVDRVDRSFVGGGNLPRNVLADAGFMLGLPSGFVAGVDDVHLYAIYRSSARVQFDFRSTASGMSGYRWLFTVSSVMDDYVTVVATAETVGPTIYDPDRGEGFITVGKLDELRALAAGSYVLTTPLPVEHALIQSLANTFASGLAIANDARRCPEPNCGSSSSSSDGESGDDSFPFALNLTGDLKFRDGYNMSIEVDEDDNTITFNARRGYGLGEPCEDTVIDEGGFRRSNECGNCDGFIGSFNGVAMGKDVRLSFGPGVNVVRHPDQHKISITVEINRACER